MLRILLVCNDIGRGGAEIQLVDVAERLAERGHHIGVCALMCFHEFESRLRDAGIQTFSLGMRKSRLTPRDLWRFSATVRSFRPDIVHAHLFGASIVARLGLALDRRTAVISTLHAPFATSRLQYLALRATDGLSDASTNVCSPGLDAYVANRAISSGKAHCTPNGIDVDRFLAADSGPREACRVSLGTSEDTFVWLTVGSFRDEQKDYGNLLRAFRCLRDRQEASASGNSELWIAGDGVLRHEKEALARSLGLGDSVRFLGLRSDVSGLMRAADAFVLASDFEAHPIALLEAAAAGLPVVATRVGGTPEIVVDGETGFLVPARDFNALAYAMAQMMSDSERRALFGVAAQSFVRQYLSLDVVVDRWEALYVELLSRKRS